MERLRSRTRWSPDGAVAASARARAARTERARARGGLDLAMRAIQQRVNLAGACRGCREPVRIEVEIKAEERLLLSPRLREASECLLGEIVDRAHRHETY